MWDTAENEATFQTKTNVRTRYYNDFLLNTTQSVTSVNFLEGDTITYSVNGDRVLFRVLKLNVQIVDNMLEETWLLDEKMLGPAIDRSNIKDL